MEKLWEKKLMEFHAGHLDNLKIFAKNFNRSREAPGKMSGASWIDQLDLEDNLIPKNIAFHKHPLSRDQIFKVVSDEKVDIVTLCSVIFAWGGMRPKNGKNILKNQREWRLVVQEIRDTPMTREQAYEKLHKLRTSGVLKGVGPAFFSKLIFFLRGELSKGTGYIMDQWTGCSINLLHKSGPIILMDADYRFTKKGKPTDVYHVSDRNDKSRYEQFCLALDKVAEILGLSQIDAELFLMSSAKGRDNWRSYVKEHRLPFKIQSKFSSLAFSPTEMRG